MNFRLLNLIIGILVILPLTLTAQTFNRKFTKHDIDIGSADNTYDVAVEDINNDGYIDIVSIHDSWVLWFKNDGAGNFTRYQVHQGGDVSGGRKLYVIDINGDNDIDILSASEGNDKVNWYENSGGASPTWTTHSITNSGDGARSVHAVDMDGDGDADVLVASVNDGKVAWHENSGADPPTWTEHQIILGTDADGAVIAGTFTSGDTRVDVVSSQSSLIVFEKGAAGPTDFTTHLISNGVSRPQGLTGMDFDADGDTDILFGGGGDKIRVWENQGFTSTPFTKHEINLPGSNWSAEGGIHAVDIDGNNKYDFLVGSQNWRRGLYLFLQDGSADRYSFDMRKIWNSSEEHPYIKSIKTANLDPVSYTHLTLPTKA